MVELGQEAPKAQVKLTDNERINEVFNLEEAYSQGHTLLYFFPASFTGVCTKSSCELRDDISLFNKLGVNVFSISVDMPFTQKVFIKQNEINYPVLSDWNKEAIQQFDIVDDDFAGSLKGVSKRALFLIKDKKIAYKWVAESPGEYPHFDEVKSLLT